MNAVMDDTNTTLTFASLIHYPQKYYNPCAVFQALPILVKKQTEAF